ncbi:MAG: Gfo/Idh/MocA family protein [Halanaerobiaceae bacterium]
MLKVGLVGIGFMGRGHLDVYKRLESEEYPVKLTAICDIDEDKFEGKFVEGNIDVGAGDYDFSKYSLYTDMEKMFAEEDLDYVDIALPTYLHADATVKALNNDLHVLCEKPMALNTEECKQMIDTAEKQNKKLMIGQCLRFWPAYEKLHEYVENGKFGNVISGYFFRGGPTPEWSYQNWLLDKDKSGGVLLDQHVHDVDMINWLFGKPEAVSTLGRNVIEGSGYDAVSTNYIYEDGKVINAQDDWTLLGDYQFSMKFRVNFEKGNIIFEDGELTINPNDADGFVPELSENNGYYREIKYFINAIKEDKTIKVAEPKSTMESIAIARKEMESADNKGKMIST